MYKLPHLCVTLTAAAALALIPISAHASHPDDFTYDGSGNGFNCTYELMLEPGADGATVYYPALPYEVANYCGRDPLIVWDDYAQSVGGQPIGFWVDYLTPEPAPVMVEPVPPVVSEPVSVEVVEVAAVEVVVPVEVVSAPVVKPTLDRVPSKGYMRP